MNISFLKLLVLISMTFNFYVNSVLKIYDFFEDYSYENYEFKEEYAAYKVLKNMKNKLNGTYYAIPWSIWVRKRELEHKLKELKKLGFGKDRGFSISYPYIQGLRHYFNEIYDIGVDVLFTPQFDPKQYKNSKLKTCFIPHLATNSIKPSKKKDILYSFVGAPTYAGLRRKIFNLDSSNYKDVTIIRRGCNVRFLSSAERDKQKAEYKDILSRSRFCLCPRGMYPDTIRFWEALKSGAIPVLISNVTNFLPKYFTWNKCVVFVKESDVEKIDKIIRNIDTKTEDKMRKKALEAYSKFGEKNFISPILEYLKK